eukprot:CAMPEP_0175060160 /NCGR_PEP_ID=MMETSP0052_2-20121109/12845_1 /TAXON_ID=51329 ORGANISM="Polytomella parva, Strain SAG 63-3" /NCGR_SAMPLE_ID=MMETSP0052_2 /ASSEMBLY_ACC=CAM_ASM_000194 /LENGTH=121 /DNA_ID=CAMNT_0016325813 /DNA_START=160 /DNA_END=522 /DNA_ORIENTATION=-
MSSNIPTTTTTTTPNIPSIATTTPIPSTSFQKTPKGGEGGGGAEEGRGEQPQGWINSNPESSSPSSTISGSLLPYAVSTTPSSVVQQHALAPSPVTQHWSKSNQRRVLSTDPWLMEHSWQA